MTPLELLRKKFRPWFKKVRVELTVVGESKASGVMEIAVMKPSIDPSAKKGWLRFAGEAVVIAAGSETYFMTIDPADDPSQLARSILLAFEPTIEIDNRASFWAAAKSLSRSYRTRGADLPREDWPMFGRFRDLDDPLSFEAVDPQEAGVTGIKVAATQKALSDNLKSTLPWISRGPRFDDPKRYEIMAVQALLKRPPPRR